MSKALTGLLESRDAKQAEADERLAPHEALVAEWEAAPEETRGDEPSLSDEDAGFIEERLKEIDAIDKRIKEEKRLAEKAKLIREARALVAPVVSDEQVEVVSEPMVYGPESDYSFYADLARSSHVSLNGHMSAIKRLSEWQHQLEREIGNDTEIGKKAEKNLRGYFRGDDEKTARERVSEIRARGRAALEDKGTLEARSIATGGGATATAASGGAAFVSPAIFLDPYAPYREFGRAFADACNKQTLPDYGRLALAA